MHSLVKVGIALLLVGIWNNCLSQMTMSPLPQRQFSPNFVPTNVLAFDSEAKEYNAKVGETEVPFSFFVTNVSVGVVIVQSVHTSCGCTIAQLPTQPPWSISPGTSGEIKVKMDVRGKSGQITKTVSLNTTHGIKILTATVKVPMPDMMTTTPEERQRNLLIARQNRQSAFRGDCARCHFAPSVGKVGEALYKDVCAVCHEAKNRASMVPDLRNPKRPATREYWADIIMFGKKDSLMPAFSIANGGILNDDQIFSLVEYMVGPFQKSPPANSASTP